MLYAERASKRCFNTSWSSLTLPLIPLLLLQTSISSPIYGVTVLSKGQYYRSVAVTAGAFATLGFIKTEARETFQLTICRRRDGMRLLPPPLFDRTVRPPRPAPRCHPDAAYRLLPSLSTAGSVEEPHHPHLCLRRAPQREPGDPQDEGRHQAAQLPPGAPSPLTGSVGARSPSVAFAVTAPQSACTSRK